MPTTSQMLVDYPDILLQVIAELRGAFLDGADSRRQAVELIASQITDPTSILMAYEEMADFHPQAQAAVTDLLKANGEMGEAQFARDYGEIRKMGPAKLQRDTPWFSPQSVAELLYYNGLLGQGYKGAGHDAQRIVYIPSDVLPWLPQPTKAALAGGLPVQPLPPPAPTRVLSSDDSFLEDAGTLLGFLHTEPLRLTLHGPHPDDIGRLVPRLQLPFADTPDFDVRLALLLHLANQLGWLRRSDGNEPLVQLTGNKVQAFLAGTRAEQRTALWQAWRQSTDWNDLCRTPALDCVESGSWRNDPRQTREALLHLLSQLQPGSWFSQAEVIQAIQEVEPDFQRPTGDYESWYLRSSSTQEFIKGFDQWGGVEGELLRFLFRGPLHWLRLLDLAEPSAGDDLQLSLSQWGALWLGHEGVQPDEVPRHPAHIGADFTVTLEPGTPLRDRFRVERFAQWQASYPRFVYQITQRSLSRAAAEGIEPRRILDFLHTLARQVPSNVASALERHTVQHKV